ncbi:MAG: hypothetical protein ACREKE_00575, partial [bacterium]
MSARPPRRVPLGIAFALCLALAATLVCADLRADDLGLPPLPADAAPAPDAPPALPSASSYNGPSQSDASAGQTSTTAQTQAELQALLQQEKLLNKGESALDKAIANVIQASGLHFGGDAVVQSEDMLVLPS